MELWGLDEAVGLDGAPAARTLHEGCGFTATGISVGVGKTAFGSTILHGSQWSCTSLEPSSSLQHFSVAFCLPHAPKPCPSLWVAGWAPVGFASLLLQRGAERGDAAGPGQRVPVVLLVPSHLRDRATPASGLAA